MPTEILTNIAHLAFAGGCVGMVLLFADTLVLRFDWRTLLKLIGFACLGLAAAITVGDVSSPPLTLALSGAGLYLILVSMATDPHSRLKLVLLIPPPPLLIFLLPAHAPLALTSFLVAATIFQLIYSTQHRELLPLALSFMLIGVAEAFSALTSATSTDLSLLTSLGYLAAALALLGWLWFYLVKRIVLLTRAIGR